ncbi:MAG: response regulator [Acidobacteriota bacterium]
MKKVLLVDRSDAELGPLAGRLDGATTRVQVACGGLYALTMLEREQPHLLLTRFDLGDMTGPELCALIKRDDLLSEIQVVMLARTLEEKLAAERNGGFDLILVDDRPAPVLAATLRRLLARDAEEAPAAPEPEPGRERSIAGTLGVLDFAELTQAFSQTGKTGRLVLETADGGSTVVLFDEGRVRHVTYRGADGVGAFARLYCETERADGAAFRLEPLTVERMAAEPCTIGLPAQQLLLTAAVELDHYNTGDLPTLRRPGLESTGSAEPTNEDLDASTGRLDLKR